MPRFLLALCLLLSGCFASHGRSGERADSGPFRGPDAGRRFDAGSRPRFDAGPPSREDAGAPGCGGECGDLTIRWRYDGGFRAFEQDFELSPCGRLLRRTDFLDGTPSLVCAADVEGTACPLVEQAQALARSAAIEMLRARAPVTIGRDTRPSDGQLLQLTLGDEVIEIGGDCMFAGCEPVPEEAGRLAGVLSALDQLLDIDRLCLEEQTVDTFACGAGETEVSCRTGVDVCYLGSGRVQGPRCRVPGPDDGMCAGPPRCECLFINNFVETCTEAAPGEVTVSFTGP